MSRTMHLTCDQCMKTLWMGQENAETGWYVYITDEEREQLNRFVNAHFGHPLRMQESETVGLDVEDITHY